MTPKPYLLLLSPLLLLLLLLAPTPATAEPVCEHSCTTAADGECDDGGPAADSALCAFGTDCADCGVRERSPCNETCPSAGDGACDDGGPGSDFAVCALGSDCADCGVRELNVDTAVVTGATNTLVGTLCAETCVTAGDGVCDDVGVGSTLALCAVGTDCADCGTRVCDNACATAGDGVCDDGGASGTPGACAFGTDCADCGVR